MVLLLFYVTGRGRPRQRWLDRVNKDLENLGTTKIEDEDDRKLWEDMVKAATGLHGL